MFRELIRKKQELSADECRRILTEEKRGVLSVIGDMGYPYGMPMNHFYDGDFIYFHSGNVGHRLDSLKQNNKASFCVYDEGYRDEGEWALNIKSVIVFGKIDIIDDMDTVTDITARLSRKFTDDEEYIRREIEDHAHRTLLLRLTPEHISGKTVNEA
ncbi:MAG: pyridoxamine 5'-phosphate oxidase family protein [Ruminococcaceae bacterium]|nr:pyridoxamine 5'-phosphate oxidase family protein [Oscillospiraceae bacterium]